MSTVRSPVLVGRSSELATVRGVVDRVPAGRGGVLLVVGEAGIGKSRLLDEVDRRAGELGLVRLTGRAVQGGGVYRAPAEAVGGQWDLAWSRAPEQLRPYRSALARLLPIGAAGEPESGVDPVVLLGEGLRRLLLAIAEHTPGCLVRLEDLHWADDDTLALIAHLAPVLTDCPVLLAVSARDEAPTQVGRRLDAMYGVTTVRLGRLGVADVAALAAACRGGAPLPAEDARVLAVRSEGLPFVVEEMLAAPGSVPPTLAALVADRLAGLDAGAREVLVAAAVLGPELDWRVLGPTTGLSDSDVLAALRAGVRAGLLATTGDTMRWPHALTRDAVLAGLLPPERAAIAGRAAAVLSARALADDEPRAAELYVEAGDPRAAARLLLELARRDIGLGALHNAERLLDTAAAVHPGSEVEAERIRVLTLVGRAGAALAAGERIVDRVSGTEHAELCLQLARTAVTAGRWDVATGYVERAARPQDPRSAVLSADIAFGRGRVDEAAELAAIAVARAEQAGAAAALCESLGVLARTMWRRDLAATSAAYGRAAQVAAEHGLLPARVTALAGVGAIEVLDAEDWPTQRRVRELALDAGMLAQAASIGIVTADGVLLTEGPGPALVVAREAADTARELRLPGLMHPATIQVAICLAGLGDGAAARRLISGIVEPLGPDIQSFALLCEAFGALVEHDLARAGRVLEKAVVPMLEYPATPLLAPAGMWALLRTVARDRGAEARGRLTVHPAGLSRPNRAAVEYASAVEAGRAGRAEQALEHLRTGDSLLATRAWWRRLAHTVVLECAVADGWGDPVPELRLDLAAAESGADDLLARVFRDLLRRAGAPTRRSRGTAVPARLRAVGVTSREVDVLTLVVRGLTNTQIAERLVLSPRTVDTHVASLLAKTGCAARIELRGWADGEG